MRTIALVGGAAVFLLAGYEFVRSPSTILFQQAYGTRNLAAIQAVSPLFTLALIYAYGLLLGRLGARRTLLVTSLASAAGLAGFWALLKLSWTPAAALLYAFREGYIVLLVEQYWAFLNSALAEDEARRWNGWVPGLGSFGSVVGGWAVGAYSQAWGTQGLVLLAGAMLLPAAFLTDAAYARCAGVRRIETPEAERDHGGLGLGAIRKSPTLVLIALLIFLSQSFTAVVGLGFQDRLMAEIPDVDARTAYSGRFYSWVAVTAVVMQLAGTPLALRLTSTTAVLVAIPLLHLATATGMLVSDRLAAAAVALFLFKSVDYSAFRVTKELLYMPLSFEARYRAKETIDAFGYRFSGGIASAAAYALQGARGAASTVYGPMGLAVAGAWAAVVGTWAAGAWPWAASRRRAVGKA